MLVGIMFTLIAGGTTFTFAAVAGPIAIVPAIITLFGVATFASGLRNISQFRSAPLSRYCAAVIDERVKLTGGGKNSSASTSYFVTLENEKAQRVEYQVIESVSAQVAPGDIGVAFTKAGYLIEYIRVPV